MLEVLLIGIAIGLLVGWFIPAPGFIENWMAPHRSRAKAGVASAADAVKSKTAGKP